MQRAERAPVGLIGGTFDPVHFGHLRLAEEAWQALGLERVLWIPAGRPPHRGAPRIGAADRLEMVRLALAGNEHFAVDDTEVRIDAPSYTVTTLERLRARYGAKRPLVLLLGSDAFAGLSTWHRWQEIFGLAHIAVAARGGLELKVESLPLALAGEFIARRDDEAAVLRARAAGRIVAFAMTPLAVSASAIRTELGAGRSVRYLLPDPVLDYIERKGLYLPHGC